MKRATGDGNLFQPTAKRKRATDSTLHGAEDKRQPYAYGQFMEDLSGTVFWLLSNMSYGDGRTSYKDIYAKYCEEIPEVVGKKTLSQLIYTIFPDLKPFTAPTNIRIYKGIVIESSVAVPFHHVGSIFAETGYAVSVHQDNLTATISRDISIETQGFQPTKEITLWKSGVYKIAVDGVDLPLGKLGLPDKISITASFLSNMAKLIKGLEFCCGSSPTVENRGRPRSAEKQRIESVLRSRCCFRLLPVIFRNKGCMACRQKRKNDEKKLDKTRKYSEMFACFDEILPPDPSCSQTSARSAIQINKINGQSPPEPAILPETFTGTETYVQANCLEPGSQVCPVPLQEPTGSPESDIQPESLEAMPTLQHTPQHTFHRDHTRQHTPRHTRQPIRKPRLRPKKVKGRDKMTTCPQANLPSLMQNVDAVNWLLSNVSYGKGSTRFGDMLSKYVQDVPAPLNRNSFSKFVYAVFPESKMSQTCGTGHTTRKRACKGIIMESLEEVPFEAVGDLFKRYGYAVSTDEDCLKATVTSDIVCDGLRPIKELSLWESGDYLIRVDGKEVSLLKLCLPSKISFKESFLANVARIVQSMDFCVGVPNDSPGPQRSSGEKQHKGPVIRAASCYRLLPLNAACIACYSCRLKDKNHQRFSNETNTTSATPISRVTPTRSTETQSKRAETATSTKGSGPTATSHPREYLRRKRPSRLVGPKPRISPVPAATTDTPLPDHSFAVTWLLSNVSYGKGTRRFGEIYNKYVQDVTIPVGRIPLARLICTVFPEAEVSQSTPAEITTIRHVCKGIIMETPVVMPFQFVGNLFQDHGYVVTANANYINAMVSSDSRENQPVKEINLFESGKYLITVDGDDVRLNELCLPNKIPIGGSFIANIAKLVRSMVFCGGSNADIPSGDASEQQRSSDKRQQTVPIVRADNCLKLLPLNSTSIRCPYCQQDWEYSQQEGEHTQEDNESLPADSPRSFSPPTPQDTLSEPDLQPRFKIQEDREPNLQATPTEGIPPDHQYTMEGHPDNQLPRPLKPTAIVYEPTGRAFSTRERINIIQEQMQALNIDPKVMIFLMDQLKNATAEKMGRRWDKHVVHLFSQLHKWNASVYAGLTASGMIIMPSARMLVNLRKKNAEAEERAAQANTSQAIPELVSDDVMDLLNALDTGTHHQ